MGTNEKFVLDVLNNQFPNGVDPKTLQSLIRHLPDKKGFYLKKVSESLLRKGMIRLENGIMFANDSATTEPEGAPLYLIMNTFAGRYLQENTTQYSVESGGTIKGNIGHECINFFVPDGIGTNYLLWFNSNGRFPSKYKNRDITLLMVTNFANEKDKFRILAKAEHCKLVPGADLSGDKAQERFKAFVNSELGNAKYGNAFLYQILADNTYHGLCDGENTMATFYTDKQNVSVPSPEERNVTIRIKKTEGESTDINQNMGNEAMRMYIEDPERIDELKRAIESVKTWMPVNSHNELPGYPKDPHNYIAPTTFFSATKNEKDELSLSNIIAFSLANSKPLLQWAVDWLTNGDYSAEDAECIISREDKHVDLTIETPNCTIVIENKVDSSIVLYENDSRAEFLDRVMKPYKKDDLGEEKYNEVKQYAEHLIDGEPGMFCQLTKYYIQSNIDAYIADTDKDYYYYFLVPNYCANKFKTNDQGMMDGYRYSNKYRMITYQNMLTLFQEIQGYPYRTDILNEFAILARPLDDAAQNREIYKFLKKAGL